MENTRTISLNMIVKNEEHCIEKSLNSIKHLIDYWIISDTGSTDNTKEKIKEILKDIPGELHENEFVDFSTNRNIVLNLSKNKSDYLLFLDADDYFEGSIDKNNLIENVYTTKIYHGSILYDRVFLVKNNLNYKYIGILHEYLDTNNNFGKSLDNCKIIFGGNGNRSKNINKFLDDGELFEKNLKNDGTDNPRDIFYCAQSFRDAGQIEKAIKYYTLRTNMGGYFDEIFISQLNLHNLYSSVGLYGLLENLTIDAYNMFPHRAEILYCHAYHLRSIGEHAKAYFYITIASKIPLPQGLFVYKDLYDYKIKEELAICSYNVNYKQQALNLYLQLLNIVPIEDRDRIIKNINECKK